MLFPILLCVSFAVFLVEGSERALNSEFLPSQCWVPDSRHSLDSEELMMGDEPVHFDLNAFIPSRFDLSRSPSFDNDDGWYPPPPPPNVTEVIANNDLRAYFFYLSDPDLRIEIKEECEATEFSLETFERIERHKYVFIDSKGHRIEVVVEEQHDLLQPKTASDRKHKHHKSSKDLMLSLIGGGRIRTNVKGRRTQRSIIQ